MNKFVYFAFQSEAVCFMHVLLNALNMHQRGIDAKIVIEGKATALVKEMEESQNPLYAKAKEAALIDCICKACSAKMGVLEYNQNVGIPLCDEMRGHPAMASYIEQGYQIITL